MQDVSPYPYCAIAIRDRVTVSDSVTSHAKKVRSTVAAAKCTLMTDHHDTDE